ncbi:MAG TPA: AmmeMemoRadiSam system protein B [Bacteroidota bacterium]|nr:AmmeMemoRadiSam system protein B [Bacteroidota bacterium]
MNEEPYVRPPAVAGMFYPDHEGELRQTVESYLAEPSPSAGKGTLLGLIVPHAGYSYSGHTAAKAFALLKNRAVGTVVLVGPSHREYFDGVSVFSGTSFKTPLGAVAVDAGLRSELLKKYPALQNSLAGHRTEHSLEVQLPFLQLAVEHPRILPIVMGDQQRKYCEGLGVALAEVAKGRDILFVASSDLSHYYASDDARKLDAVAIASIRKMDHETLMSDLESERTEACGGGPIVAVLSAARKLGADSCEILDACNSGDVSGDTGRVVGYVSAALWKVH